jgi:membrane fusion protein, multidrug efflux system
VKPGDPPADLQPQRPQGQSSGKAHGGENAGPASGNGAGANQPKFYVETRTIKVDLTEGTQVILADGLKPGEKVVVDGQEKLRNGSRVIPRQSTNPNGPRAVNPNRADTGVTTPDAPQRDIANPKLHSGEKQK